MSHEARVGGACGAVPRLDAADVWRRDELLELRVHLRLCVRVDERRVDVRLLDLLAAHLQVLDQLGGLVGLLGHRDHRHVLARLASLDEGVDGRDDPLGRHLRLAEHRPHLRVVNLVGELGGALDRGDVVDEHLGRLAVQLRLLEDDERLLVQLRADGDVCDVGHVEVGEAVDVVHHARLVRLDGGEDEQVLQVPVVGELRVLQHDLLEQLDQLVGQVGRHEGLDGGRHHVGVLGLREGDLHHGVDELPPVLVLLREDGGPQLEVLPLDEVASLGEGGRRFREGSGGWSGRGRARKAPAARRGGAPAA